MTADGVFQVSQQKSQRVLPTSRKKENIGGDSKGETQELELGIVDDG